MLDEDATDKRSDEEADGKKDVDDSDEYSTLLKGDHVANEQVDQHVDAAAPKTLYCAPSNEDSPVVCSTRDATS